MTIPKDAVRLGKFMYAKWDKELGWVLRHIRGNDLLGYIVRSKSSGGWVLEDPLRSEYFDAISAFLKRLNAEKQTNEELAQLKKENV